MKYRVGIIGNGFVGESTAFAFSPTHEIRIYDKNPLKSMHTKEEVMECDFVFIAVPTPMKEDGSQDMSKVIEVFENANPSPIYIIKSTILPGTTRDLKLQHPNLKIVFSPEFLTERTAKLDMMTQARIILGGDNKDVDKVEELINQRFKNRNIIKTDSTTAEFVKYMNNTYFATKVSLMNEYYRMAKTIGVNWQTALHGFVSDGRVTDSHLDVPGPDGKLGFGGTCFPKDINALITMGKQIGTNMNVLEAAWKTNLEVRPEQDWNNLKGRAVS